MSWRIWKRSCRNRRKGGAAHETDRADGDGVRRGADGARGGSVRREADRACGGSACREAAARFREEPPEAPALDASDALRHRLLRIHHQPLKHSHSLLSLCLAFAGRSDSKPVRTNMTGNKDVYQSNDCTCRWHVLGYLDYKYSLHKRLCMIHGFHICLFHIPAILVPYLFHPCRYKYRLRQ